VYYMISYIIHIIRNTIGILLNIIGLIMIVLYQWIKKVRIFNLPTKVFKDSYLVSFLMGVSFTLAFCPTMFVLFLLTLMPIVLITSYGVVLPSVFGIGASLPLLLVFFLFWYFGASGAILKRSRKIGAVSQKIAGVLLLIIGILDTLTYLV